MPDFMLLLHQSLDRPPARSAEDAQAVTGEYLGWGERMGREGRLKGGQKLTNDAGRVMRAQSGRVSVTDGPYAESREVIGGYFTIAARDYDEACRLAETCPHLKYGGRIEVRQIDTM